MQTTLENGKLFVKGEMTNVYQVVIKEVRSDMFLDVELIPNEYTENNGIEKEYLSVDSLNETVVSVLKEEGYKIIKEKHIKEFQDNQNY